MTTNIEQFNSAGIERIYWAVNSAAGYPYGVAGAISAGADAGMGRLIGTQSFSLPLQPPREVPIPGDDSVQAIYQFQPETLPSGDLILGNIDVNLWAKSQGINVYADGDWDAVVGQPDSPTFNQLTLITLSQAKSAMSGSVGNAGWYVTIFPRVQLVPIGNQGLSNAAATSFTHRMIASITDKLPWGESFTVANHGTTRAAMYQFYSENRVTIHTHVGNNSDDTLTLAYTPAAANGSKVRLRQDGTAKTYTTHYSVSSTTFTFAAAPGSGVVSVIYYEHT